MIPFRESFRINNYRNVVGIVESYDNKSQTGDDLKTIKGGGKGTIRRTNEILESGTLSEISYAFQLKKPVIGLNSWNISGLSNVNNPGQVMDFIKENT